jgi:hypothetical protein
MQLSHYTGCRPVDYLLHSGQIELGLGAKPLGV